jgi:hypothetical protein
VDVGAPRASYDPVPGRAPRREHIGPLAATSVFVEATTGAQRRGAAL